MSKELLKALVDVLDDLKLRKNLSDDDALNISDSVLMRAENAIKNYLAQPEQTAVAWITEWVQRYRHNDTPIIDRAVSFTKGDAPAVPNPNYIPLYTSPPKREPLSDEEIYTRCCAMGGSYTCNFIDGVEWAEHQHGIRSFDDE